MVFTPLRPSRTTASSQGSLICNLHCPLPGGPHSRGTRIKAQAPWAGTLQISSDKIELFGRKKETQFRWCLVHFFCSPQGQAEGIYSGFLINKRLGNRFLSHTHRAGNDHLFGAANSTVTGIEGSTHSSRTSIITL